ncbi:hypothetical protein [Ktedonospora formicarum]|uniref:Uncharacterized protein n=1 Tax=Ktedonospora formicarum TaxID=2778364 RepID=A0A8J3I6F3_9CHLR|nr:hypothetical protein [Ktedonospora formicarum]GHO51212.1 hypothetical protein KSX_93750 [Ktedonospora formicarum]
MQKTEAQMRIPLKRSPRLSKGGWFFHLFTFLYFAYFYWRLFVLRPPLRTDVYSLLIYVLSLLLAGALLLFWASWFIRPWLKPPVLHITHEGIFLPGPLLYTGYLPAICVPIFLYWQEIRAVFPYLAPGDIPVIGIDVYSYEAIFARSMRTNAFGPLQSILLRYNKRVMRQHSLYLTPINIRQSAFPCTVEDVLSQIHMHFAAELQEHRVNILGQQDWRSILSFRGFRLPQ